MSIAAPSQPYVINYADARLLDFPCSGAGSSIPLLTPMMPGVTAGTNKGVLIPVTASSSLGVVGLLADPHNFSLSGDATTQTLVQWFAVGPTPGISSLLGVASSGATALGYLPSHRLDLIDTAVLTKMDYAISDASSFTVTSAGSTVIINNGSFAAGYDSAFIYFSAGAAIGELGFVKSSVASTSATLVSALTVAFAAGDTMVIILPLFANIIPTLLVNSTTVPTKIDTNVATGTNAKAAVVANFIAQNNLINRLDPLIHHKTQNLQKLAQLGFFAYLSWYDTLFHQGT